MSSDHRQGNMLRRVLAKRWADFVFELVTIVIGVLLALGVDGWRTQHNRRATVERVLETVRHEVQANRAALELSLPHHLALVEQVQLASQGDESSDLSIQLRPAFIRNTAWETAQATQATLGMDYGIVAALSELYLFQSRHDEAVARMADMLYSGSNELLPAIQDLIWYERQLQERYNELLELVGPGDSPSLISPDR